MRPLPGWASLERWLPMTVITRPVLASSVRLTPLLLIGTLTLGVTASVAIVGSRSLESNSTDNVLSSTALIPQGDEAVFAFASYGDGDVFTVYADGTDLRQLTDGPGVASYPVWSPDGTRIAYHEWRDGADSLVVIDSGGDPVTLATNDPMGQDCNADYFRPAWAPDGSSLIFPTRDGCYGAYDLSIVAADGSSPATRLLSPGTNGLLAAWSPDGTQLAYLGSEGTGGAGLYVAQVTPDVALSGNVEGRRITSDLGHDLLNVTWQEEFSEPRWSPDGTEIAVAAVTEGFYLVDAEGVYIVKADGSGQRLLAERAGSPTWSPDGQRVAFHRTVDPSEYVHDRPCTVRTWLIDADGTDERELPEIGDGCDGQPVWSPDGTRLASVLIMQAPGDPEMVETSDSSDSVPFHLGFVMVDGVTPPVLLQDGYGSWQPVVAPLPPALADVPGSPAP